METQAAVDFVAPGNETERQLSLIWAEVLGLDQPVGIHDDFFNLGGHSLLATRVISRVRSALGRDVALKELFSEPTVAGFARVVALGEPAETVELVPVPRDLDLPLSFSQQRLWFLDRLEGAEPHTILALPLN